MYKTPKPQLIVAALLLILPAMAQAHPGHGPIGWESGLTHPLLGMDHLLAMVAVGLWAVQLGGRALWAVPASFVGAMLLGAHMSLPMVESGVLTSLLVIGLLITFAVRVPVGASAALVGIFAIYHGCAHGLEKPGAAGAISYSAGFALTTTFLLSTGIAAGMFLQRVARSSWTRILGAGIAIVGAMAFLQ